MCLSYQVLHSALISCLWHLCCSSSYEVNKCTCASENDTSLTLSSTNVTDTSHSRACSECKHDSCSNEDPVLSHIKLQSPGLAVHALRQIAELT